MGMDLNAIEQAAFTEGWFTALECVRLLAEEQGILGDQLRVILSELDKDVPRIDELGEEVDNAN